MELLYLWIRDFRGIQNQGFNFSSRFSITAAFDERPDPYSLPKIFVEINRDYVELFPNSLVNVTGIVGKNGSGKSTLLQCLKTLYGRPASLQTGLVYCFYDQYSRTIHTFYHLPYGYTDTAPPEIYKSSRDEGSTTLMPARFFTDIGNPLIKNDKKGKAETYCAYIYNGFDQHPEEQYKWIINKSMAYELNKFITNHNNFLRKRVGSELGNIDGQVPLNLKDFKRREVMNWIKFISFASVSKLPILPLLPKLVTVKFDFSDKDYIKESKASHFYQDIKDWIGQLHEKAMREIRARDIWSRDSFLIQIYLGILYSLIRNDIDQSRSFLLDDIVKEFLVIDLDNAQLIPLLRYLLQRNRWRPNLIGLSIDYDIVERVERAAQAIYVHNSSFGFDNSETEYEFVVDEALWTISSVAYDLNYGREHSFLRFEFEHDMSSGEEAFLRNCSKLLEIKNEVQTEPVLILIDEGELYLHPAWQRRFLCDLIEVVQSLFRSGQVQVILTTHSPFIISDLPRANLIFLKKEDRRCIVSNENRDLRTFGANIHELFMDGFFLESSLMGEFARKKIETLIKEIKGSDRIKADVFNANFRNRIMLIGEHYLKVKLLELVCVRAFPKSLQDDISAIIQSEVETFNRGKL